MKKKSKKSVSTIFPFRFYLRLKYIIIYKYDNNIIKRKQINNTKIVLLYITVKIDYILYDIKHKT